MFHRLIAAMLVTFGLVMVPLQQVHADNQAAPVNIKIKGSFEDVWQDLQDAVINRGLVIDYIGHVDNMLERTSDVAESVTNTGSKSPYVNAKYLQFCSAKLTHNSVSANPYNLSICPYVMFAFEAKTEPGEIIVGYRRPVPSDPSKRTREAFAAIEKLLDDIVKETSGK